LDLSDWLSDSGLGVGNVGSGDGESEIGEDMVVGQKVAGGGSDSQSEGCVGVHVEETCDVEGGIDGHFEDSLDVDSQHVVEVLDCVLGVDVVSGTLLVGLKVGGWVVVIGDGSPFVGSGSSLVNDH